MYLVTYSYYFSSIALQDSLSTVLNLRATSWPLSHKKGNQFASLFWNNTFSKFDFSYTFSLMSKTPITLISHNNSSNHLFSNRGAGRSQWFHWVTAVEAGRLDLLQNNLVAFCSSTVANWSGIIADIRHQIHFNSRRDMSNGTEHMLREAIGWERRSRLKTKCNIWVIEYVPYVLYIEGLWPSEKWNQISQNGCWC